MSINWWRLKTGSIVVALAIGTSMALPENAMAQNRWELFQNDWNVAVEQDKLAISKGCIDPEQKAFLIDYTIMAGEGFNIHLRGSGLRSPFQNPEEIEGHDLIDQLRALRPCDDFADGILPDPVPDANLGTAIINPVTPPIFSDIIRSLTFMDGSNIVPDDAAWEIDQEFYKFSPEDTAEDAASEIDQEFYKFSPENDAAGSGTARNFLNIPLSGLGQSFHTVRDYFTTPNDFSLLNGRSWGVQDYGTLKGSKTQEVIQDAKTVPAKGDVITPGQNSAATTGVKQQPLDDASKTSILDSSRKQEIREQLLPNPPAVTGVKQQPLDATSTLDGNRKQEIKEHLLGDNKDASGIGGGHKQELLEGSKNGSFNSKGSLEEKSFKNSTGEKSSRSTFTGDRVFSQQGTSKSFAPMGGKTFSGTGTKPPTSGKSLKMHGF